MRIGAWREPGAWRCRRMLMSSFYRCLANIIIRIPVREVTGHHMYRDFASYYRSFCVARGCVISYFVAWRLSNFGVAEKAGMRVCSSRLSRRCLQRRVAMSECQSAASLTAASLVARRGVASMLTRMRHVAGYISSHAHRRILPAVTIG